MRVRIDIPDKLYLKLKNCAAREAVSVGALILRGVQRVLTGNRRKRSGRVTLPIIRSKEPGTLDLDNEKIYDILFE